MNGWARPGAGGGHEAVSNVCYAVVCAMVTKNMVLCGSMLFGGGCCWRSERPWMTRAHKPCRQKARAERATAQVSSANHRPEARRQLHSVTASMRVLSSFVSSLLLSSASIVSAASSWSFEDATVSITSKGTGVGGGSKDK
jgi:hypothetical protein